MVDSFKYANDVIKNAIANNSPSNSPEQFIRQLSNENTARTFEFNSSEAEKARDFSEYMSNTSHQREVTDLRNAGLNPVLSVNGGAQAYSASSASGTADNSAVSMLASLYQTKMNNDNAVKIAKLNNANNKEIAKINAAVSKYSSDNSFSASKYASDLGLYGKQYGADRTMYGIINDFISGLVGTGYNGRTNASGAGKLTNFIGKTLADHSPRNPKNVYKYKK